jgi:hypothetical protein
MSKILDKSVTKVDDNTYDFVCPGVEGSPCGEPGQDSPNFASTGWPTKAAALARGAEHFAEHKGEGVMSELVDFRAKHKLGVNSDGKAVKVEDL